jgi:general L-amino acid transport system permease protein
MSITPDPRPVNAAAPIVNYDEPPVKPPPLLAVGPLGWARRNLFNSWSDTFLTLLGITIIVGVIVSFAAWVIGQANWFAILFNFRLYMLGRYELSAEWRVTALILLVAFTGGVALAAWVGLSRRYALGVLLIVVLLFGLPPLIQNVSPVPVTYLAAGTAQIKAGSDSLTPQPTLAFIARQGETVTVAIATDLGADDAALSDLAGFVDDAANQLRNLAGTHLDNSTRMDEINALLAGESLTQNQRDRLTIERDKLQVPPAITETYNLNNAPVQVRLLNTDGDVLGEAVLTTDSAEPLRVTIPADGWYILEKQTEGSKNKDTAIILRTQGIYPLLERSLNFSGTSTGGGTSSGSSRVSQYSRMTDGFIFQTERPQVNGKPIPITNTIDLPYRGIRSAGEYLSLFIAPFFDQINLPLLFVFVAFFIGYLAARQADQRFAPREAPRRISKQVASWLLIALPFVMFLLVSGLSVDSTRTLLGWVFFGAWLSYLYHAALYTGHFSGWVLVLVALPLMLDTSSLTGSLIRIVLGLAAVYAGWQARTSLTARRAALGLIASAAGIGVCLLALNVLAEPLAAWLPLTDTARWGGLLLTMMLTVVGIIGSFPIGVALALGRRSSLPVISGFSTIYIETVRGVPLITVLFMTQLLLPLVDPGLAETPNAIRAMVAVVLFSAAYLAENVRGGLQSIPPGQEEAARALGLNGLQITLNITLPQALRAVIPALVGQFISLFKDTSLVAIVGLLDLSGMGDNVVAQTEFLGLRREVYVFLIICYFSISYFIATISRRIESSGAGRAMARKI